MTTQKGLAMPEHDEDALKSLMIRGTEDLTLRRDAAHQAIKWQRRRRARPFR